MKAYGTTLHQLRWAIITVMAVLALAFVMNLSGQTITLGTWMAAAGGAFALLSPILGWLGVAVTGSDTSANSLLQATAPARLRGQTISLYMLVMRGGLSIGGLLAGVTADLFGVRYALLLNGVLALVAHAIIGRQWLRADLAPFR